MSEPTPTCDECGSPFVPAASAMAGLCSNCAHFLYGYPACAHDFADGACRLCGWDGSVSNYIKSLAAQSSGPTDA